MGSRRNYFRSRDKYSRRQNPQSKISVISALVAAALFLPSSVWASVIISEYVDCSSGCTATIEGTTVTISDHKGTISFSSSDSIYGIQIDSIGNHNYGTGTVSGAQITITSATMGSGTELIAGHIDVATNEQYITGNKVIIQSSVTTASGGMKNISGGYTAGMGNVIGNSIEIIGDSNTLVVNYGVVGGYAYNASSSSLVSGNSVTVSGSKNTITGNLRGGFSRGLGTVTENTVTFGGSSNTVTGIYGGYAEKQSEIAQPDVKSNYVIIAGTSNTVNNFVYGGYTDTLGTVSGNYVYISGEYTTVSGVLAGGYTTSTGDVTGNVVHISGDSFTLEKVYGGKTSQASSSVTGALGASGNSVTISSGSGSADSVIGGYAENSSVTGNTVSITGVMNNIQNIIGGAGGYSGLDSQKSISGNGVIISGSGNTFTYVYGGYGSSYTSGDVAGNYVYINGDGDNSFSYVRGGVATNSTVTGNYVIVTAAEFTSPDVVGGYATGSANATDNYVYIKSKSYTITDGGVVGGYSTSDNATGNIVNISGSGTVAAAVGGYSGQSKAFDNKVSITGNTSTASKIYGGYSNGTGEVSYNKVTLTGSNANSVYGGYSSESGTVLANSVDISGGGTLYSIYGGSGTADVSGNTVSVSADSGETTVSKDIYGGYTNSSSSSVTVYNNTVSITSDSGTVSVDGTVYGGYSYYKDDTNSVSVSATYNTVTVDGDGVTLTNIYGGRTRNSGEASHNTVTISSGTINGLVMGGLSSWGDASSNTVTIYDGEFNEIVYGGRSAAAGTVTGNTVNIYDGTFNNWIMASRTDGAGKTYNNTLNIYGGTLNSNVYGAYNNGGEIYGNTIYIYGGTLSGSIYLGNYSADSEGVVQNSTIYIDGASESKTSDLDIKNATFYASNLLEEATGSAGNTLNISNFSGSTVNFVGFDSINVDLTNIDMNNAVYGWGSVIVLTDENGTNLNNSTITFTSSTESGGYTNVLTTSKSLATGYTIIANANGITTEGATITDKIVVVQDSAIYQEYPLNLEDGKTISYGVVEENDPEKDPDPEPDPEPTPEPDPEPDPEPTPEPDPEPTPEPDPEPDPEPTPDPDPGTGGGPKATPAVNILPEHHLAMASFLNAGTDFMLDRRLECTVEEDGSVGTCFFGAVSGGRLHQDMSGNSSWARVFGTHWFLGVRTKFNKEDPAKDINGALWAEAGWGTVRTGNSYAGAHGHNNYYGVGALAEYKQWEGALAGAYAQAYAKVGNAGYKVKTNLRSADSRLSYDKNSLYVGAGVQLGYEFPFNENLSLDTSARYSWLHLEGFKTTSNSIKYKVKDVESHRTKVGTRIKYGQDKKISNVYAGIYWEHEYSGKARGTVDGLSMTSAGSLKGSSGVLEVGAKFKPSKKSRWTVDGSMDAYFGKKEGLMGNLVVNYKF